MMSLTPNGTPASGPCRPPRSNARAAAIAAAGSKCAKACTTGSRSAMRSRQARTTASLEARPLPMAETISVAVNSWSGLMARPLLLAAALNHTLGGPAQRGRSHAQEANQFRQDCQAERSFLASHHDRGARAAGVHLRHDVAPRRRHDRRHRRHRGADPAGVREPQSRGRGGRWHAWTTSAASTSMSATWSTSTRSTKSGASISRRRRRPPRWSRSRKMTSPD